MRSNHHGAGRAPAKITNVLLILLACAGVCHAHQQQQRPSQSSSSAAVVAGRVTDQRGGAVAGATVTLYERASPAATRAATATDGAGRYRFERLAPGEYVLEAGAEGFAASRPRVLRVARASSQPDIDLTLEVAGVREEVVVTAQDAPQTSEEVSKAVDVVTAREMDERDEYSVAEALRTVPGLRVQQSGGPGAFTSIKTRGLRNQDTAVDEDGPAGRRLRLPRRPRLDGRRPRRTVGRGRGRPPPR